ncbi:MAG: glutaredoxin [Pseudomonadales bacterium]|nr:glutaredoxin [Pseudomonadales bacterium]NRA16193.1 glutaredoxin [Oceanospirillaceae bacterium]
MQKIEIYTRPGCGYCTHAKRLLLNRGLTFVEYDVYLQPEKINQLHARTSARAYPQIFIGNISIGGFSELLTHAQHGLLTKKSVNYSRK